MPRVAPRDARRAEVRGEIVAAAWELCRESGLAGLSLRELAARVGMRAPSLYSYFPSKHAIYDAMFRQGYEQLAEATEAHERVSASGRDSLKAGARAFFRFSTSDPVRYQLLFQRTIPGFQPSADSYAVALRELERLRGVLTRAGYVGDDLLDLWTALLTGLTDQQLSNDPGGTRWERLVDDAVDMFADHAEARQTRAGQAQQQPRPAASRRPR